MAKIVTFGEVMLRLATPGHFRFGQTNVYESTFGKLWYGCGFCHPAP